MISLFYSFILTNVLFQTRTDKYIALKVVKSAPHYTETAIDEIRLLEKIRDADIHDTNRSRIVRLLNHFTVRGVNGVHTCLVFEALGCSLYKLIVKNNYQGLAIQQVKSIIKQVSYLLILSASFFLPTISSRTGFTRPRILAYQMPYHTYGCQTRKYLTCDG